MVTVYFFVSQICHRFYQSGSPSGHNSLRYRGPSSRQSVVHLVFQISLLGFGYRANFNHRHSSGQLCHSFTQFGFIKRAFRFFDLLFYLSHSFVNSFFLAFSADDRRIIFGGNYFLRFSQIIQFNLFQSHSPFLANNLRPGQNSNIFQHIFFGFSEFRRLDGQHIQNSSQFIDYQSSQRIPTQILGDNHQIFGTGLGQFFQNRQNLIDRRNFLIGY